MVTLILVAAIAIMIVCFAAMGFAFAFIIKNISKERYKITEAITLPGEKSTDIIHLDDDEKESWLLRKAESDVKYYVISTKNVADTDVRVVSSAISEMCDAGSPTVYYINVIVCINRNNVNSVTGCYFKYGVKCTEEENDTSTDNGRCKGCGSELSGSKKCKYCGMIVTEPKPNINTVEIYKINS